MKRLTFTFDNGPAVGETGRILDFLAARSIKTTFFVTGQCLRNPDARRLAERAHAEGHWLGNHTLTHGEPLGIDGTRARVEREIGETERLLGALAHPRKFFRPNGRGHLGPHLLSQDAIAYLVEDNYTLVTWNNVPRDWVEPHAAWVERAIATLAGTDWSLLVLHDEYIGRMMETLTEFHDRITRMGVEITQEMPPSCTPLIKGKVTGDLQGLVTFEQHAVATPSEAAHV